MDRLSFGALVSILRDDMGWTQSELAERSGLDTPVVSIVERGERRGLIKDGILQKLATGLELTTLERREFFLAASGVSEHDSFRPLDEKEPSGFKVKELFENTRKFVRSLQFPAFVFDSYGDVLLANRCSVEYYEISKNLLATANKVVGGYNMMRLVFHPESGFRKMVGNDWEIQALINLRSFRRRILRYRQKKYARNLLTEFLDKKKYPWFEKYWRRMLSETVDELGNSVFLSETGIGCVGIESFLAMTPYGELYLYQLLPTTNQAVQLFQKIMTKVGNDCIEFAPFPDKRKL